MIDFTVEHKKIIYSAIRKYQMNHTCISSKEYNLCNDILNNLFDVVTESGAKPSTHRYSGDIGSLKYE
jgi:hypothetical protein